MVIPLPDLVELRRRRRVPDPGADRLSHAAHGRLDGPGPQPSSCTPRGRRRLAAVQLAGPPARAVFGTVSSDAKAPAGAERGSTAESGPVISYAPPRKFRRRGAAADRGPRGGPQFRRGGQADVRGGLRCLAPFGHLILTGAAGDRRIRSASPRCRRSRRSQRLHGADGDAELSGQDTRERRALLRPHARGPAAAAHRKTFPLAQAADAQRYLEFAAVDGQADPHSVTAVHTMISVFGARARAPSELDRAACCPTWRRGSRGPCPC